MPRESGIYRITCSANGKIYLGSASNMYGRAKEHLSDLRRGKHHAKRLQRAWDKYGEAFFSIEVVEKCARTELRVLEQGYLDLTKAADPAHGFNASPSAGSVFGLRHSAESREKISKAITGRVLSETHKARIGDLHRGRKRSDETRDRIRQANLGKTLSPEHRRKISDGLRKRNADRPPPAPKCKIKKVRVRKPHSQETRAKLRAAALKRFSCPAAREKLASYARGKKLSPEHAAALRAGHAAYLASRTKRSDNT